MGTRGTVHILDGRKTIVSIYRQMDSYPTGLGQDIKALLVGAQVVNGYGLKMDCPKYFNGMGCLGAWLVGQLKLNGYSGERKDTIGNLYLTDSRDRQEFNYFISASESLTVAVNGVKPYATLFLKVTNESGKVLYHGTLEGFNASKVEKAA